MTDAIDDRKLWDDLIDMRLVQQQQQEEGAAEATIPTDSVLEFYRQLGSHVEIPNELIGPCLEAFKEQKFRDLLAKQRSDQKAPGLIVPQPKLGRDRFTAKISDLKSGKKIIRFRYDKAVLLNSYNRCPDNRTSTLPYGLLCVVSEIDNE